MNGTEPSIPTLAQRLWLLERRTAEPPSGSADVHPYTSAIALLDRSVVRLVFVRSSSIEDAALTCMDRPHLRLRIERDARSFDTLDAAIACAEASKMAWIARGWTEIPADGRDL